MTQQDHQDHQAFLKAKYCPRVAAASCTQKNTWKTHVTLTYDLEIEQSPRGCQGTCAGKISSSWVQRFMSYCVHKLFALSRNSTQSQQSCPVTVTS